MLPPDELSSDGAEPGKEFKMVAVERVGTVSVGTCRAVAATDRSVQTDGFEAGACPKEVPEPDIM